MLKNVDIWGISIEKFLAKLKAQGLTDHTIRSRKEHIEYLARRIKKQPAKITTHDLIEFMAAQQWKPETRRSRRASYIKFFQTVNPAENPAASLPKVKSEIGKPRPAPEHAYTEALRKAAPRETLMLRLAAEQGLRRAEVAQIHTDDIEEDLLGYSLRVHGKGRKTRIVPLKPDIAALLTGQPPGYIFPGADRGHLSPRWVGTLLARLLPGKYTMHTLRHRFATRAYQVNRDVFVVQELLGHSSADTTRRYCELPNEALRQTVLAA